MARRIVRCGHESSFKIRSRFRSLTTKRSQSAQLVDSTLALWMLIELGLEFAFSEFEVSLLDMGNPDSHPVVRRTTTTG